VEEEYQEDLIVSVTPKGGEEKKVFNSDITSKKEFNS